MSAVPRSRIAGDPMEVCANRAVLSPAAEERSNGLRNTLN
jgi:hypothetical protein